MKTEVQNRRHFDALPAKAGLYTDICISRGEFWPFQLQIISRKLLACGLCNGLSEGEIFAQAQQIACSLQSHVYCVKHIITSALQ
jgi:hypothetical protein